MSFVILSNMMFLEFFSVVIASSVNDTYVVKLEELRKSQINKFKQKWTAYDKEVSYTLIIFLVHRFYEHRKLP
jgi:hypothetical protein